MSFLPHPAFTVAASAIRNGTAPAMRNGSVDLLRFAGALGIVWFHLHLPGDWIGLAALPMFVMLVVHYGAGRPLAGTARRLLVPWAIWSAIYGLAKAAQALSSDRPLSTEFVPWMILTGPAIHLWFLPFCVIFLGTARLLEGVLGRRAAYAILGGLSVFSLWAAQQDNVQIPLAQWVTVWPAACLGLLTRGGGLDPARPLPGRADPDGRGRLGSGHLADPDRGRGRAGRPGLAASRNAAHLLAWRCLSGALSRSPAYPCVCTRAYPPGPRYGFRTRRGPVASAHRSPAPCPACHILTGPPLNLSEKRPMTRRGRVAMGRASERGIPCRSKRPACPAP